MINLPTVDILNFFGKNVLVRGDFDVENGENPRADSIREMVRYLFGKNAAKIKVIGHTETDYDLAFQLKNEFPNIEFDSGLRKNPGEKENNIEFARDLAVGWNIYINESFATSHRQHASIVTLPKVIKGNGGDVCVGIRFQKEIENLNKVISDPKRPVIMAISGIKEDKLSYIEPFCKFADKILIGGKLPDLLNQEVINNEKIIIADLIADREDVTIHSIEKFEDEISKAGTVVVSGPVGKFEDEGHRQGTEMVFRSVVANKDAFKLAGGGDTERAIQILDVVDGFDWISVGGGAMLEFLANGTLPGIEALMG
jgi:phosphoglycerate kinase